MRRSGEREKRGWHGSAAAAAVRAVRFAAFAAVTASVAGGGNGAARAQTNYSWTGSSTANGNWTTNANWNPASGRPGLNTGDTAAFSGASGPRSTVTLDQNIQIASLSFTGGTTRAFTIDAATAATTMTLGSGAITNNVGGGLSGTGQTQTINATVRLNTAGNFTVASGATLLVGGDIQGSAGLTKNGVGRLILAGTTSYTGGTTIAGGMLQLGDGTARNGSVQGNIVNNASGRLIFANPSAQTYGGTVSGTGTVRKTGAGPLTLTGIGTDGQVGNWRFEQGATLIQGAGATSRAVLTTGTAFIGYEPGNSAAVYVMGTDGQGNASTWDASDGLVAVGNGSDGMLNITGGGRVDTGIVFAGLGAGGKGTIIVSGTDGKGVASTLSTGGRDLYLGDGGTFTMSISDGGRVDVGGGAVELGLTGSTGALIIDGGRLSAGRFVTYQTATSIALTNPTAANGGGYALTIGGANGSSTIGRPISDAAGGAGGIHKVGSGTLTLTGANTYSGGTLVSGGTVAFVANDALGTGTVTLATGTTLAAVGGPIALPNALTLGGMAMLNSGTFATADALTPGLSIAGPVTLASENLATNLNVTGASRVTLAGPIGQSGALPAALFKTGAGTLELRGDSTYTGGTLVAEGTLVVNNAFGRTALGSGTGVGAVTVANGATLTGTYKISGPVQVNPGGTLSVGNSIGTSGVGFLSLSGGSVLGWEIGADGLSSDRLEVASLLSRTGPGGITFGFSGERLADGTVLGLSEGTFTLFTFGAASNLTAADFFATGLPAGWESAFALSSPTGGGGPGALTVTLRQVNAAAAPEPSALLLVLLGTPGVVAGGVTGGVVRRLRACSRVFVRGMKGGGE